MACVVLFVKWGWVGGHEQKENVSFRKNVGNYGRAPKKATFPLWCRKRYKSSA